ncbi:hypothetical protein ACIQVO_35770 [Streptomyces sp. NPDC101062]|uniref:hypothetical protein n=1 Tax=unclassified Streptomyces TaxID=2593676 RepID=UPI002E76705A|nr:hypothetical protein [Streptomyces sp. JV176]MEE1802955.1 hypothetical protein [Streptomyces sp. JV176]
MPTWITPRRLGVTATLYAVFVGGWYLGQPLDGVGCRSFEATAERGPGPADTIREPGDLSGDFSGTYQAVERVLTAEVVDTSSIVACDSGTPRPRLVAWVTGDWR